ncbi:hypothetical protein KP509_26G034700 [Ceratopteris richardii]|uniref:FAS1 domain-containing protein n=2 Tax=Ceratopteris richardii TaxID=49495 RepID=A0A8T2RM80_CERRI|nr:hypothetical protein KP509_26G034700 [Ceratopteris richardii]
MAYQQGSTLLIKAFLLYMVVIGTFQVLFSSRILFDNRRYSSIYVGAQELSNDDFNVLLTDLRDNKFYTGSSILGFLRPTFLTRESTLLMPTDLAISTALNDSNHLNTGYASIVQFHILSRGLNFEQLELLPVGTWIPSMAPGKGVQVTSIGPSNYSLNHAKIIQPDLCPNLSNVAVTCQGIDRLLDFSSILSNVPRNPPVLAVPPSTPSAAP